MKIIVIDDLRRLKDGVHSEDAVFYAINSKEGLCLLIEWSGETLNRLYLDHDLGGEDTIRAVVSYLEERGYFGDPFPVEEVLVHTSNIAGGDWMMAGLSPYYTVKRVFAGDYFTQE